MNRSQPAGSTATATNNSGGAHGPVLVIAAESLPWRRQVGPLAWTTLQHLALSAHRADQGWVAAVGVRDIGVDLGITKDTAARAVSTLVDAGLVTRGRVPTPRGQRRSGYLLHLPRPIRLIGAPHGLADLRGGKS